MKPENILLRWDDDGNELEAVLCDFGLACRKTVGSFPTSWGGTKGYMPPVRSTLESELLTQT